MRGLLFIVTIGLLLYIGCSQGDTAKVHRVVTPTEKPAPSAVPEQKSPPKPGPVKKEGSGLTIEALGAEYKKDPKKTLSKYAGKTLEITGEVHSVRNALGRTPTICFSCTDASDLFRTTPLMIYADNTNDPDIWQKIPAGATITLRVRLPANATQLEFTDTVLIKADPSQIQFVDAKDLTKEYSTNLAEAHRKWGNKYIHLEGVLILDKSKAPIPLLEGDGDWVVWFSIFHAFEIKKDFKHGQKVWFYGRVQDIVLRKTVMFEVEFAKHK